jgi:phage terminase large subunit GpA-like protein
MSIAALQTEIDFFLDENSKKKSIPPRDKISEYIAEKRTLPTNTPFPGPWDNDKTPYLTQIMDWLSPSSNVQHVVLMKAAQIGGTAVGENIIGYYMDECPSEILYISATDRLLERWAIKRLEPLIDGCGFRNKIIAQTENKNPDAQVIT